MVLPTTLMIPTASAPFSLASRRAASVSAVLTRLADGNHHGALFHQRIAIAKFAGVGAFSGNLGQVFQQIITDHAGMPCGCPAR